MSRPLPVNGMLCERSRPGICGGTELLRVLGFGGAAPAIPRGGCVLAGDPGADGALVVRVPAVSPPRRGDLIDLVAADLAGDAQGRTHAALDFVFTRNGLLAGCIPALPSAVDCSFPAMDGEAAGLPTVYDAGALWLDMRRVAFGDAGYLRRYAAIRNGLRALLFSYAGRQYGGGTPPRVRGTASLVRELPWRGGVRYEHRSLDALIAEAGPPAPRSGSIGPPGERDAAASPPPFRADGPLYLAMPGVYLPGKYVDIGYYDAIEGRELRITGDDTVLVIGPGAGIDLIRATRHARRALAIEINPFAAASCRVNLNIAGLSERADVLCADVREAAAGTLSIPEGYKGTVTKILWNMPYESATPGRTPRCLREYADGYAALDWFLPFLSESRLLAPRWDALIWNIMDDAVRARLSALAPLRVRIDEDERVAFISKRA